MRKKIVLLALLAAAGGAGAQQAWRCGNSYSARPCPGGAEVSVAVPHSDGDAARAAAATKVDARRADALERARLAREKQAPRAIVMAPVQPASAAGGKTPAGRAPAGKAGGRGRGKLETFTATAPGKPAAAPPRKKKTQPSS